MELEINLKNLENIQPTFDILKGLRVNSVCITDKPLHVSNLIIAKEFKKTYPELVITTNFSITNQYQGSLLQTYTKFEEYLFEAKDAGVSRVLVVSGNPKRQLDSVQALEYYNNYIFSQARSANLQNLDLACAFNPFLIGEDLILEQKRLVRKLSTGMVKIVYLQIGENPDAIISANKFIRHLKPNISISGCLLVPTISLLHSFRQRPWHGVKFSNEYLSSFDTATYKTQQILETYKSENIKPLIELLPINPKTIEILTQNYDI